VQRVKQGVKRRSPEGVVTALRLKQSISCVATNNERSEARRVQAGPRLFELIPLSPPYLKNPTLVGFFMSGG